MPVRRIDRKAPADLPGSKEDILTPDKANAVFLAGLAFPLTETDPDYRGPAAGQLHPRRRHAVVAAGRPHPPEGRAVVRCDVVVHRRNRDPVASLTVNAITNPANIDKVDKAVAEELEKFLADGPSPTELADAKKAYLESQKVGRTGDAAIAGQIVSNLQPRPHVRLRDRAGEDGSRRCPPEDVKAAFQKYVDPKKLVIIRAGDFKK